MKVFSSSRKGSASTCEHAPRNETETRGARGCVSNLIAVARREKSRGRHLRLLRKSNSDCALRGKLRPVLYKAALGEIFVCFFPRPLRYINDL